MRSVLASIGQLERSQGRRKRCGVGRLHLGPELSRGTHYTHCTHARIARTRGAGNSWREKTDWISSEPARKPFQS